MGQSANSGSNSLYSKAKGITTGQRDTFLFDNIRFYNINNGDVNGNDNAAVGTCSHCAFSLEAEGFGNTAKLRNLQFSNVGKKIQWSSRNNAILHDMDGSLTGDGA